MTTRPHARNKKLRDGYLSQTAGYETLMAKPEQLPNGTWRIRWTNENGVRCGKVFSSKADAEFKLRERQHVTEQIRRGLRPKSFDRISFDEICDYWLKHKTSKKRSPKDDLSIINGSLRPFFSKIKLEHINRESVDRYCAVKLHLNIKTVHNHLTVLISLLNLAVDLGHLEKPPRIKKPKISLFSADYRYLRTNEEIQNFLSAAATVGEDHYDLCLTAIMTGLRKGELAGLKWSDINFDRQLITVQRSFDKPTKSGCVRYLPLLDQLKTVLQSRRLKTRSVFVFPDADGLMLSSWHRIFEEDLHLILENGKFESTVKPNGNVDRYIVFHSLRHTFASHWVMNGGDIFKLQKILGHASIQMTMRYAHLAPQAFAEDLNRFSMIKTVGEPAKVIEIREKTARS